MMKIQKKAIMRKKKIKILENGRFFDGSLFSI